MPRCALSPTTSATRSPITSSSVAIIILSAFSASPVSIASLFSGVERFRKNVQARHCNENKADREFVQSHDRGQHAIVFYVGFSYHRPCTYVFGVAPFAGIPQWVSPT